MTSVSIDDVCAAAERLRDVVPRTPLERNDRLSELVGADVWLKREDLQPVRSYKLRGAYNFIASLLPSERSNGVVCASAGNHGQGVAFTCRRLGVPCRVVLPRTTPRQKRQRIQDLGGAQATIVVEGHTYDEAHEAAVALAAREGAVLVPPFDDPRVIAGQGTVGLEILEDVPDAAVLVVPCGGGGLVSGIAAAAPGRRVIAVEPELSPALHRGLAEGRPVPVEPQSIADGLSAPFAGESPLAICRELGVESVLVTEDQIAEGMRFLYTRAKLACEPAGAVGVAALLAGKVSPEEGPVAIVVSGGNVAPETAVAILGRQ